MADAPTPERPKRYKEPVVDFFADIGITGNDQQQAKKDTYACLDRYIEENKIDRTEDLHYDVAAEAYVDELPTKFMEAAHSELPGWYMSLCTAEKRGRQLALDSIEGVFKKQITAVAQKHTRFKNFREHRRLEEAATASDVPSNSEETRLDTPASEWGTEDDGVPVNPPRSLIRFRKPVQPFSHNTTNQSRIPAASFSISPQVIVVAAPRMVRDLSDHNARGLRETPGDLDADSEDYMKVLHPRKRLAREKTLSSNPSTDVQRVDDEPAASRERRETFEIPDSPELGPAPLAQGVPERTSSPSPHWIDQPSSPQPAFEARTKRVVDERTPELEHRGIYLYAQPVVRPSPAPSRTDGSSVLLLIMVNALENATEIAEVRAQLDQGQQRGHSEDMQVVEAAVPTAKLREILSLVKE